MTHRTDIMPNDNRTIDRISAVTLLTSDLQQSLSFYQAIGFAVAFESERFVTLLAGESRINLVLSVDARRGGGWGRVILYVNDVDAWYEAITRQGIATDTEPRNADWQERYFQVTDPSGHQLSFAMPLES